jgi:hypothetical protein
MFEGNPPQLRTITRSARGNKSHRPIVYYGVKNTRGLDACLKLRDNLTLVERFRVFIV